MRAVFKCIRCVVVAASLYWGAAAYSQLPAPLVKSKKNAISFLFSYHNFFDGHPMFTRKPQNASGYKPVVKGLEYRRMFKERWGFFASFKVFDHLYWDANSFGDVRGRNGSFWDLNVLVQLWAYKGISVIGLAGPSFRYGIEGVFVARYFGERLNDFYKLRDPGVTAGLRLQYTFPSSFSVPVAKNLTAATDVKFMQIIWRYNSFLPYRTYYPNRSTRQMLTLQFGVGYRF